GHGIARWRASWRCLSAGLPSRDRAALQEVERSILECPFDVPPRAVNFLALQGELGHGGELGVVEAGVVPLLGRHLLLEGSSVRQGADRDPLAADLALEHLAGAIETKVVWYDEAVDYGFTETPTGFNHALIGAGDRILGKHNPGGGGVEKGLDYYAD